jgi:hypothetical protein
MIFSKYLEKVEEEKEEKEEEEELSWPIDKSSIYEISHYQFGDLTHYQVYTPFIAFFTPTHFFSQMMNEKYFTNRYPFFSKMMPYILNKIKDYDCII